ncbi:uncharacterized protein [Phaseolus vulgaris]|uniref:uncharacterized protein isoform X2 n=1 Tax=Phaseolus vulgaris TaxID=3885 RepID=UPI0035CBF81D
MVLDERRGFASPINSASFVELRVFRFSCSEFHVACFVCQVLSLLPVSSSIQDIVVTMDPSLSKFMNSLKRQAKKSKVAAIAGVKSKSPIAVIGEEPTETAIVAPVANKKRGRPTKVPRIEAGSSSGGKPISMLGVGIRVAPTMQFDLRPEDEGILAAVPTLDLITEMVELQCRAAVVSHAIGEELKRAESVVIPKLKRKLDDSATSLKRALESVEECQREREKDIRLAKEEQEALKTALAEMTTERNLLKREKDGLMVEKKSLTAEIEQCQSFMLRVSEESFNQGVRQVAFFHGVPTDDDRYDPGMDVVDGRLVPLGGEEGEEAEGAEDERQNREEIVSEAPQQDEAIEIV